ncbi:MAG: hypothetical protein KDK27_11085, partial [Leptospiraceae bacterium]|nr:hypothetical protein [Leptospiraceae bacterium]
TGLTTASPGSIAIRIASTLDGSGVLLTHQSSPDLRSYLSATDGSLSEQDVENCGNNSTASISYNGSMAYVSSLAGGSICVYTRTQNGQLAHIQTLTTTAPVSNYLLHRRIRLL